MKPIVFLFFLLNTTSFFAQNTEEIQVNYAVNDSINDAKVIEFANLLQTSLYEYESSYFLENFDSETFAEKIMLDDKETNGKIKGFNLGFKEGFLKKFDVFPTKIIESIKKESSYNVVNYYYDDTENKYHILFRAYSEIDGLNYHDYQLNYTKETFKIEDVYIYTTGEYLSDTLRQLYLISIPKEYIEGIDAENNRFTNMLFFLSYKQLVAKEKYKEAYDLLSNLKGDIKNQKVIYIMKIQVASAISEVYYMEAIDELLKKFPDDPSTQLMAVDYFIMLKDYNATMSSLDALEAATNDTFIEFMRGNLAWEFNDYENAEKSYKATLEEYPSFDSARINLIYMYDESKQYDVCISMLDEFITNDIYDKKDLIEFIDDELNELKNLATAPAYTRWKEKK